MNIVIKGKFINGYLKPDRKDKESGEIKEGDYVIQMVQQTTLDNGEVKNLNLDIPIDRKESSLYESCKIGDDVSIECGIYAKDFAPIYFTKAK